MIQDSHLNIDKLEETLKEIFRTARVFLRNSSKKDSDLIVIESNKAFLNFKDRLNYEIKMESRKEEPDRDVISDFQKKIEIYQKELDDLMKS